MATTCGAILFPLSGVDLVDPAVFQPGPDAEADPKGDADDDESMV
jgi:hypothetical protein